MKIYNCFVDFQKTFDSLDHQSTWAIMKSYGIEEKLVKILQLINTNGKAAVRIRGELGDWLNITRGTRQGDNVSPKTFIGHLERFMDKNKECGKGISINGVKIGNLCFADDIDLLEESPHELQRALQLLSNEGRKTGLVINKEKTKTMVFDSPVIKKKLKVDGQDVENVTEFVYLVVE